ncbi:MAG: hypothetical protein Q4G32_10390 [Kocuria sp.]|nr:hypothetical protein [Kocuria sp.]MDO5619154.1 hypothetical protein [Kocuria sp.]
METEDQLVKPPMRMVPTLNILTLRVKEVDTLQVEVRVLAEPIWNDYNASTFVEDFTDVND